jgi:hypothetical protein
MTGLNMVFEDLRCLPPKEFEKAAEFVHDLRLRTKRSRADIIDRTAGSLKGKIGESLAKAIGEGCEKVDKNGW